MKTLKTYQLGIMEDRIITVGKCDDEFVVSIKRKDDQTKCIDLPPKR